MRATRFTRTTAFALLAFAVCGAWTSAPAQDARQAAPEPPAQGLAAPSIVSARPAAPTTADVLRSAPAKFRWRGKLAHDVAAGLPKPNARLVDWLKRWEVGLLGSVPPTPAELNQLDEIVATSSP